jgi:hypothetical protein
MRRYAAIAVFKDSWMLGETAQGGGRSNHTFVWQQHFYQILA